MAPVSMDINRDDTYPQLFKNTNNNLKKHYAGSQE